MCWMQKTAATLHRLLLRGASPLLQPWAKTNLVPNLSTAQSEALQKALTNMGGPAPGNVGVAHTSWMPKERAIEVGKTLYPLLTPDKRSRLSSQPMDEAILNRMDTVGTSSDGAVRHVSFWEPGARVVKEQAHSLPTAASRANNMDLNPAPSVEVYRERLYQALRNAGNKRLHRQIDSGNNLGLVDLQTGDNLVINPSRNLISSYFRRLRIPRSGLAEPQAPTLWPGVVE